MNPYEWLVHLHLCITITHILNIVDPVALHRDHSEAVEAASQHPSLEPLFVAPLYYRVTLDDALQPSDIF